VASSGGPNAEGLFSLMQMAKTVSRCSYLPKPACPTSPSSPTDHGGSSPVCHVADIILAEPGAVMSFAGRG